MNKRLSPKEKSRPEKHEFHKIETLEWRFMEYRGEPKNGSAKFRLLGSMVAEPSDTVEFCKVAHGS